MVGFKLRERDVARLELVHPDLVAVVNRAAEISPQRFMVVEGIRTVARQRELVKKGASKTMNSRHIPAKNGFGHAVDLAPVNAKGAIDWNDKKAFEALGATVKRAADDLDIEVEWGGDWRKFYDGPHFQLSWRHYPGNSIAAIGQSRTMRGISGAGAGVAVSNGALDPAVEALEPLVGTSAALDSIYAWLKFGAVVLTIGGLAYAAYARWDDAGRPLPSWAPNWLKGWLQ